MASEFNFEEFVIKYFSDQLMYRRIDPGQFNSEWMLIPSQLISYIEKANPSQWKLMFKEYSGDTQQLTIDLCKEVSSFVYESHNVAINLNPKKHNSFKFKGRHTLNLYSPYNSSDEDINDYAIMSQFTFKIYEINKSKKSGVPDLVIKPDVGIFINGLLFSYMQLKFNFRKQSAADHGRGQCIGDYLESLRKCVAGSYNSFPGSEQEKIEAVGSTLKYFHGPAHILTMDETECYTLRGINAYFEEALQVQLNGAASQIDIIEKMKKNFFMESFYHKVEAQGLNPGVRTCKVLENLFSKESIQREILYFNFLAYKRISKYVGGVKEVKVQGSKSPNLCYPRPNQKYGVDKVVNEIVEKYKHENEPDYEIKNLESRLKSIGVPETEINTAIDRRKTYKNNKNQFSLLLQYAAGFGKTYIICWLSLILKDLKDQYDLNQKMDGLTPVYKEKIPYLFDKILLVADRVDLRDQVDRAMFNMNIEKSLFAEADTKDKLKKFLVDSKTRVVIVNIQKFPKLKDIIGPEEQELLKNKRIAFIIDEIHRSNDGAQHKTMANLFDELVDTIGGQLGENNGASKKNLVIGLTATPTDENLARFGEYQACTENVKWVPFDAYTTNEANDDGFTLNCAKAVVPCAVELAFEENDAKKLPKKENIYENKERIEAIAKKIAKILVGTTYRRISGYGKAMLACYSIKSALMYFDALKKELNLLAELPKYQRFKDAGAFIVYSDRQDHPPAHTLCKFDGVQLKSEKEVLGKFQSSKNGIMIVVDKLQTGFDEPLLHTLFLDKEVRDIAAVQTASRVNRVCTGKDDCLIVDFSIDNANVENIRKAFMKYGGVVCSDLDTYDIQSQLEKEFKEVKKTEYYVKYYAQFKANIGNMDNAHLRQQFFEGQWINEAKKIEVIRVYELYLNYLRDLSLIDNVIGVDASMKEAELILFMKEYLNFVSQKGKRPENTAAVVDFWVEDIDFIQLPDSEVEYKKKKFVAAKFKEQSVKEQYNLLEIIKQRNAQEKDKEVLIAEYKLLLVTLFSKIEEIDLNQDGRLIMRIKSRDHYSMDEIGVIFEQRFNQAKRRLKSDAKMQSFIADVIIHKAILIEDFCEFILQEKHKSNTLGSLGLVERGLNYDHSNLANKPVAAIDALITEHRDENGGFV